MFRHHDVEQRSLKSDYIPFPGSAISNTNPRARAHTHGVVKIKDESSMPRSTRFVNSQVTRRALRSDFLFRAPRGNWHFSCFKGEDGDVALKYNG